MRSEFHIGRRLIGPSQPTYFVADIGANHDGDLSRAVELISLAADAGADAAKFQNFRAETIVSDQGFRSLGAQVGHQARWKGSVYEVYEHASLPLEWTEDLAGACRLAGIDYFTAPYDIGLIDALNPHVCAWKVGSGDITWLDSIEKMSRTGKPVLIATGASSMADVVRAVNVAAASCEDIVILQCNTNYSNLLDNFNFIELNVLKTYAENFPSAVLGLSDHTPGATTVLGAVALGARVIEKHLTDDQSREGPDHGFSMTPADWREMVDRTRDLEAALGTGVKRVMENEQDTFVVQRRSLRATRDLPAGLVISAEDLDPLRPCPVDAIAPYELREIIGKRLCRDVERGDYPRLVDLQ